MRRIALPLVIVLTGCSDPGSSSLAAQNATQTAPAATEMIAPANGSGEQGVMGAVPGPCGSEKVGSYAGQRITDALLAAVKAKSGAAEVKVFDPKDKNYVVPKPNPLRLNLMLDQHGVIVLIDCG